MAEVAELVQRAQSGDLTAYDGLVRRFQDMAVGYSCSLLGDFHLAEDASLEVVSGLPSPAPGPAEEAEERILKDDVLRVMGELPGLDREIITSEYSQAEIGRFLGVTVDTVKNRLRSARRRFEERMLDMTREALCREAPSRDGEFATVISLCNAAEAGDLQRTKEILASDPSLATRPISQNGQLAIQFAAREGHLAVVETLLGHGANPNQGVYPNRGATSALAYARDRGHTRIVASIEKHLRVLPQKQTDPDDGERLRAAVASGDIATVRQMLEADSDLANCASRPLLAAAEIGHVELVTLLLEAGADPEAPYELDLGDEGIRNNRGEPLWRAAAGNHSEVCRLLLEAGADPNVYLFGSGPAAERAMENGNDEILDLIYSYGGKDFAVAAAMCGKIGVPAEVMNLRPDMAPSILGAAGLGGNLALARLCVGYDLAGADWFGLIYQPMRGRTRQAEHRYADGSRDEHADKVEILRLMLESGADPNARGAGQTPLHRLIGETSRWSDEEKIPFARLLLDYGTDIDARDDELKSTALGFAARYGHENLAAFLIERGASISLPDDEPWATPLAWAEKQGHATIADLLRRRRDEAG